MKGGTLYLIDAYAQIYRSYFAFAARPLRDRDGRNISVLFGFARALLTLFRGADGGPRSIAAAFDSRGPTFRHERYPQYKATRPKAPADLHAQVPLVESLLDALQIPVLKAEGFEADDIIATIAERCRAEGRQCRILSSDKDLLQLVGDGVFQLRAPKAGAGQTAARLPYEAVGRDEVRAEWGVPPEQILDLLALTGDSSDNVPGVKGVGGKTAVRLLSRYGSLDEIYRNIASIDSSLARKLAEGKADAYLSRELITLRTDVPLSFDSMDALGGDNLDFRTAAAYLDSQGIPSLGRELRSYATGGYAAPQAPAAGRPAASAPALSRRAVTPAASAEASSAPPEDGGVDGLSRKPLLDLRELEALLAAAKAEGRIALSFEADLPKAWHAKPYGLALAVREDEAFYVPLCPHGPKTAPPDGRYLSADAVSRLLAPLLGDKALTVIAHNAKRSYEVSRVLGLPRWACAIRDTMIAAWLRNPERTNYALADLARDLLGIAVGAPPVPKGGSFDCLPLETACRFAASSAAICLRLQPILDDKLREIGAETLFRTLEMPLIPILAEMEGAGIKVESAPLLSYGVELGMEIARIEEETRERVGHAFNMASPKQLQQVLFVELGLQSGKKTKTGYSTDVAVLEGLARTERVPALILRHRVLCKLKSTYVDVLPSIADSAGRVHTSFIQNGTATGRLSSRDPNLQNIPVREEEGRRIRSAFVAGPGMTLLSADYSQIELVVLAHLSGDGALTSAFIEGKDVHARTAALIFGIDEAAVTPKERRVAKVINFGVMYGMSAFRLAGELGISRTDAAAFIDAYFRTYSGVKTLMDGIIAGAERDGYVSTLFGRRRAIPAINSPNKTEKAAACRIAVNTPIQGTAADIVKRAMIDLDAALARRGPAESRLLLQVHDELILECPENRAAETALLVREVMEKAAVLTVPLRVSVETGKSWGEFH